MQIYMGLFRLSSIRFLFFYFFPSVLFDMENTIMITILWRNYLLTLKLAYIYQYFTVRFLTRKSTVKSHSQD